MSDSIRRKAQIAQRLAAAQKFGASQAAGRSRSTIADGNVRTAELFSNEDRGMKDEAAVTNVVPAAVAEGPRPPRGHEWRSAIPYSNPAWRVPLAEVGGPPLEAAIERWEIQQKHEDRRPVMVQSAVAVGSAIAFRTYDGICALDAATGRRLWKYVTGTTFSHTANDNVVPEYITSDGGTTREHALDAMLNAYSGNSILGSLTTDGLRVFAIDSMEIASKSGSPIPEEPGDSHSGDHPLRSTNRLVALDLFAPQADQGGQLKPAWTVGGSVGTAHRFHRMDVNDDGRVTQAEFLGSADDFHKLDRNGDGAIDKAEADHPEVRLQGQPLDGHFFLGPPLALDGRLYAVTESDCQLNLVALNARTGEVLWVQGIGYVDRPIDEDPQRYSLECTPAYANGVIVCPTQIGILVGVDAVDGALLWTYYYGDEDVVGPESGWTFVGHRAFGNSGFPNPMLIDGNRIVILPRQSNRIHCVELSTGRGIWTKQRGDDAAFIAGSADGVVMIVGERLGRGLSLVDGADRWSARLGEVSGTGMTLGPHYVLPLAGNRTAVFDIRTGSRHGSALEDETERESVEQSAATIDSAAIALDESEMSDLPVRHAVTAVSGEAGKSGNLINAGSLVISVGPREAAAYPRRGCAARRGDEKTLRLRPFVR